MMAVFGLDERFRHSVSIKVALVRLLRGLLVDSASLVGVFFLVDVCPSPDCLSLLASVTQVVRWYEAERVGTRHA